MRANNRAQTSAECLIAQRACDPNVRPECARLFALDILPEYQLIVAATPCAVRMLVALIEKKYILWLRIARRYAALRCSEDIASLWHW